MSILIKGIPLGGYEISIMKDGERYRARVDGIWCEVEEISTTEPDTDTISRQAAIDGKICIQRANGVEIYDDYAVPVEYLEQLPPAQPERIKARWLPVGMADAVGGESAMWGDEMAYHACDNCWQQALEKDGEEVLSDFCPFCGAEMEVTT